MQNLRQNVFKGVEIKGMPVASASRSAVILAVSDLQVGASDRLILHGADLTVKRGEIVGLLGPNGAGKSTALHAITGIIPIKSGAVFFGGFPSTHYEAKNIFGFAPDDLPLPFSLTGAEFLHLHRRIRGASYDQELAGQLVFLFDIGDHLERPIGDFSHGMRRKLQFVASLAHRPQLLILDEPLRGLDPEATILLNTLIKKFVGDGGAVLLATHDLEVAQHTCDCFVVLSEGKVVISGRASDVLSDDEFTLEEVFLRMTHLNDRICEKRVVLNGLSFVTN